MIQFLICCGVAFCVLAAALVLVMIYVAIADAWSKIKNYNLGEIHAQDNQTLRDEAAKKDVRICQLEKALDEALKLVRKISRADMEET